MAFRVSMGQYVRRDSVVHALDPRTKITCAVVLAVAAFAVHGATQLAFAVAAVIALIALSHVGVMRVVRSMRPITAMLVFLGLVNLFVVQRGAVVWSLGPIRITEAGLSSAVLFPSRMAIGAAVFAVLLLTTTPSQLTDAFDAALGPLSRVGLPGHELAMVFSLMLRFVPTLGDEARAVLDTQAIRGAGLGEGSPARRVRAVVPAVTALLASSLRHAENLSRALDARCYEGGASRSHWHPIRMTWRDVVAAVATCAFVAGLVLLG